MDFKKLHHQSAPLLMANVWDVPSAKIAEQLNFQAIGTSSAAIASVLGYEDGEEISFSELEYIVKQIATHTQLPLSVDLESGYGQNPTEIVHNIKSLVKLGVVGINIEDSIVKDQRILVNAHTFAEKLFTIIKKLENETMDIFVNVRTDTFLLNVPNALEETKKRIKLYQKCRIKWNFCSVRRANFRYQRNRTLHNITNQCDVYASSSRFRHAANDRCKTNKYGKFCL